MASREVGAPAGHVVDQILRTARFPEADAVSLPPAAYTDPHVLELEQEAIFRKKWINLGRADEIAEPGSYLTGMIGPTPVLVVRQKDGGVRAFANVCSHRGMQLAQGAGKALRFTCAYHGWTFGLDGQLLAASLMRENFCKKDEALIELRHEIWLGFMFVTLDQSIEPLAVTLKPLAERLSPFQIDRMRTLRRDTLYWDCNWKIALENGIEPYHISTTHNETLAPYAPVRNVEMEPRQLNFHAYNHRFDEPLPIPQGPSYIPNTSGDEKIRSYAVAGCIYPNIAFSVAFDWVWWITCHPLGTGKARIDHGLCAPFDLNRDQLDLDDPELSFLHVDTAFMPEDRPRVEGVQIGVQSGFARQGKLSPMEETIRGFISQYAETLARTARVAASA